MRLFSSIRPVGRTVMLLGVTALMSACNADSLLSTNAVEKAPIPSNALLELKCTGNVRALTVTCEAPTRAATPELRANLLGGNDEFIGVSERMVGGQNQNLTLTSSNISYDGGTQVFAFDVTVQNLLNEALGSINGVDADPNGIRVFFYDQPVAISGTGTITVANADGTGMFTGSDQPYYQYNEILDKNEVSAVKSWQFSMPNTVNTFGFTVYVETTLQAKLVINELVVNPAGNTRETAGDWVELYNAGSFPVELQGMVIADSAASGRRPYHLISSSVIVPAGGYVVLGSTTNTTDNGGVPVDYAYGTALQFASSLDAFKISYVLGTDTVTIDRTQYSNPSVSAQDGVSRELKNPAYDNSNMDGSNWALAAVTAVYGPGGRGTPKAQNSSYVAE